MKAMNTYFRGKDINKKLVCGFIFFCIIVNNLFSGISFKEANEVYKLALQEHKNEKIFTDGEYLFMNISVKCEEDPIERDGALMMARFHALRKYVCEPYEKERMTVSPFGETMAKFVVPEFVFSLDGISVITVFEEVQENMCTQILAFDKKQIEDLGQQIYKQLADMKEWDSTKWASLLAEAYKTIKYEEDKIKIWIFLGCPILNSIMTGSLQYNGEKDELSSKAYSELNAFLNSGSSEFYTSWKSNLWIMLWWTKGNLCFLQSGIEGEKDFSEAVSLFKQGKDLPKILSLLKKSIESMPNNADKWRYLGGSLIVMKKYPEALVAYIQAARLDPNNLDVLLKISELCAKCNLPLNSEGIQWYVQMLRLLE